MLPKGCNDSYQNINTEAKETKSEIEYTITALSDRYGQFALLSRSENLSDEEITKKINIPAGARHATLLSMKKAITIN